MTMSLTAATKDQARESHDREITGRPIRSKILDEEFHDYQKLVDNAKVELPPFTLLGLPALRAAPSMSGQKRGIERLHVEETEDAGTSGGGA